MLKFEDCFENNIVNTLKDKIKSIKVENCVDSFIKYIENALEDKDTSFETRYRKELYYNYEQVILRTKLKEYKDKSKEEILEVLKKFMYDINSSIRCDAEDYSIHEVFKFWPIEDIDACDEIKHYMTQTLDRIVEEANKTAEQKEIDAAMATYNNCKKRVKDVTKDLENAKAKLINLGINIEKE